MLFFSEKAIAPEPLPAIILSRSGPAVATTKSPAIPLKAFNTSFAFDFLAVSPVIITAPVDIEDGVIPAFLYSSSTIFFTPWESISVWLTNGVK